MYAEADVPQHLPHFHTCYREEVAVVYRARLEGPVGAEGHFDRLFEAGGRSVCAVERYVYNTPPDFGAGETPTAVSRRLLSAMSSLVRPCSKVVYTQPTDTSDATVYEPFSSQAVTAFSDEGR
jgi:hypothetical protein